MKRLSTYYVHEHGQHYQESPIHNAKEYLRDKSAFGATLRKIPCITKQHFIIRNVNVDFVRSLLLFVTDIDPSIRLGGKNLCRIRSTHLGV